MPFHRRTHRDANRDRPVTGSAPDARPGGPTE
ncbi:hypothetical protein BPC006_II1998 [Burkholderia pseudomallei BPC006]|nr:hypothetical protein BPC006_II1998 [Burkholderia pseudomallei BPC006]